MHDARHMTDFEALMWNLDADPRLSSVIANITVLDQAPDWDRLVRRLDRASVVVPRLRQHVVTAPGGVVPPRWADDPTFSLDRHVRRITLKGRRSRRAALDAAMEIFEEPFDRNRPLWDFVVIDGLADGRAAMLQRLHHAVTDGIGAIRISEQFVDFERNAPEPDPVEPPPIVDGPARPWGDLGQALGDAARRQVDGARKAAEDAWSTLAHPQDLVSRGRDGLDVLRSTARQARLSEKRCSPLWTERSLHRRLDTIDVSLADAKAAAAALGGTINDFFVTGAVAGAGEYHRRSGCDVDNLRVAMPISTRHGDKSAGGNLFSPSQTVLPAWDMTPLARFEAVRDLLSTTKAEKALGAVESLAGTLNLLPHPLLVWAGYRASSIVDFVTSNMRAAPIDVYLGGALMESNYPIGPLAGTAFNLSTMSYRGTLNMGLVTDPAAIDQPDLLRRCIEKAFKDLLRATP
jgi:WS/DGAT/MGAT family acyltransferase